MPDRPPRITMTTKPEPAGSKTLEVLFTPADFEAMASRDLGETVCVVFDVLRATTSMVVALSNGAKGVIPVKGIREALALRQMRSHVLLAGEREGLRIGAELTGSVAFDLGNSPREFTAAMVRGKTVVMTTTNGTRALNACTGAREVFAACLLNLQATGAALRAQASPRLSLVCSGTFEEAALEDVLGAGALCAELWDVYGSGASDGALMAREFYEVHKANLERAIGRGRNGRRLLSRPELAADVGFCAKMNSFGTVARLLAGELKAQGIG
jgi:2-phosphosulfolactate phosphatase